MLDRISLVDPPATSTPGIISSIRSAIVGPAESLDDTMGSPVNQEKSHSFRFGLSRTKADWEDGAKEVGERMKIAEPSSAAQHHSKKVKIKREGWVHTGVYGFELGGYSVFAGKGIDDFKYNAYVDPLLCDSSH